MEAAKPVSLYLYPMPHEKEGAPSYNKTNVSFCLLDLGTLSLSEAKNI